MKATSKILSLLLAILIVISMMPLAMISASAAEQKIYFEVPENWTDYQNIFCHIWPYGQDPLANWQSKREKCTLEDDGTYSYDISKVVGIVEDTTYCVIFSADTGMQTYDAFMSTECLGDTLYCDGTLYENPVDSSKTATAAFWGNQDPAVYGPVMQITSVGNVIGTCLAPDQTAEGLFEVFIYDNLENARTYSGKSDQRIIDDIINALGVSEEDATSIILSSGIYVDWNDIPGWFPPNYDDSDLIDGDYQFATIDEASATITKYLGNDTDVTLPETLGGYDVVSVDFYAFDSSVSLVNLTIPGNIIWIDACAFGSCPNLETVTIEDGVEEIYAGAFEYCTSLETISIPASVSYIYNIAPYCTSLKSITVHKNNSFYESKDGILFTKDCDTLVTYPAGRTDKTYTVPNSVTGFSDNAFAYNPYIESVTLPEDVWVIPDECFSYCTSLKSITLPDNLYVIGYLAFSNCVSLESITLPESLEDIYYNAFKYCSSLKTITIPKNVCFIDGSVFNYCDSLGSIKVQSGNKNYKDIDGVLFTKDGKNLVKYPSAKTTTNYTVPEGVKALDYDSFLDVSALKEISLPKTIADVSSSMLGLEATDDIYYAVYPVEDFTIKGYTNSVAQIYAEEYGFTFVSLGSIEYDPSYLLYETYGEPHVYIYGIGGRFENVVIPEIIDGYKVREIESWAFMNSGIKSITIPKTVTYIGSEAMGFEYDEFYDTVKTNGFTIYGYTNSAAEAYANSNGFDFVSIGIVDYDPSLLDYYFNDDDTLSINGISGLFEHIEIPAEIDGYEVTDIDSFAFYYEEIMSITVPETVTYIGIDAFGFYEDFDTLESYYKEGFTIFGYPGSEAENYANYNGFIFVDISEGSKDVKTDSITGVVAMGKDIKSINTAEIKNPEDLPGAETIESFDKKILGAYDINLQLGSDTIARVKIPCADEKTTVYGLGADGAVIELNSVYEDGYLIFCTTNPSGKYIIAKSTLLLGDADLNGTVNIKDATIIQKHIAKVETLEDQGLELADVNSDYTVNVKDATVIQKYVAKIPTEFPIG